MQQSNVRRTGGVATASLAMLVGCLVAGCIRDAAPQPATPPPPPPLPQSPGAPLPPGWVWPFNQLNLARVFSSPSLVSPGILRPVDVARVAPMQNSGPCAPVQVVPNVWITPMCQPKHVAAFAPSPGTMRAFDPPPAGGLPASVDLRASSLDGPVKNQQMVGVCWSFAISTLMDNGLRRAGRGEVLAPMHIIASGIWDEIFQKHRSDRDLTLETTWPYDPVKACELDGENDPGCEQAYHVKSSSWRSDPALSAEVDSANQHGVFRITRMESIPVKPAPTDQFATILASGQAIYVGFDFSRRAWTNPPGGVISDYPVADSGAGHGVALVGYRSGPTGRQFLIHNSWGMEWGDHGHAWISEAMVQQHVHRAFTIDVTGPSGQTLPKPGPVTAPKPSSPSGFPFPFPFPFPGAPSGPAPAPSGSDCPAGQARDMVFGSCQAACPDGSPRVAALCAPPRQGAPAQPAPSSGAPPPAPASAGCAPGQVRDLILGRCAAQCRSGLPPANGLCL